MLSRALSQMISALTPQASLFALYPYLYLGLFGFKSKFTYYLHTIESFEEHVDPIEEVMHTSFLPSLFGRAEPLPKELKEMSIYHLRRAGLGFPILSAKVRSSLMSRLV